MQIIKSLIYMFIFFLFLQIANYIFRLFYFLFLKNKNNETKENKETTIKMLQCEKCKTYILKSESQIIDGKIFCKDHNKDQ